MVKPNMSKLKNYDIETLCILDDIVYKVECATNSKFGRVHFLYFNLDGPLDPLMSEIEMELLDARNYAHLDGLVYKIVHADINKNLVTLYGKLEGEL